MTIKRRFLAIGGAITAAIAAAAALTQPEKRELKPGDVYHIGRLDPDVRDTFRRLIERAYAIQPKAYIVSSRRTREQQNALYAQGRTKPGAVVTGARGCRSWHVLGRAVDIAGMNVSQYRQLGQWWKRQGGRWGGDFENLFDGPHYEYHPGVEIWEACPDPDGPVKL